MAAHGLHGRGVLRGGVEERHPAVARGGGAPHGRGLAAGDDHRRAARLHGWRIDADGVERPGGPVVAHRPARPEPLQHTNRLVRAGAPLRDRCLQRLELVRVLAADTHSEHHAATGGAIELGELLGHDHGVVERCEQDGRPDPDPLGLTGEERGADHRLRHRAAVGEMPRRPERIDAQRFEPLDVSATGGLARSASGQEAELQVQRASHSAMISSWCTPSAGGGARPEPARSPV